MKKSKILLTTILAIIALSAMSTLSNAALQTARNNYTKTDTATNWIINVRNMEAKNGGMGLNEVIDTTTGLPTTASNGIDVHLQKNTEYGAAILLGASDYGKQGTVGGTSSDRYMDVGSTTITGTDRKASTTGNVTGIYDLGATSYNNYWEWTAGGGTDFLSNIAPRYRDIYETSGVGKAGDATIEGGANLGYWHNGGSGGFALGSNGFVRGNRTNRAFSFNNNNASNSNYARACVVSGSGLLYGKIYKIYFKSEGQFFTEIAEYYI